MTARLLLVLPVVLPIAVATLLAVVRMRFGRIFLDAVATATSALVIADGVLMVRRTADERLVQWMGGWQPRQGFSVGIPFVADRVSAGAVVLVAATVTAGLVFSWRYFESAEGFYHPVVLLFMAGMCGFVLTGDLFDMFVFFELMGAVAYALTGYRSEEQRPLVGAVNFAIVNSLGAFCTLMGIALLYSETGQLSFAGIGAALSAHGPGRLVVVSFVLIISGWLVKAAVVPFHFWTADAEAVAPTPVCVLFSCAMVELGLYGVARVYWEAFRPAMPPGTVRFTLLCFGAATALVGGVMCFLQHHLKRLLAYSTISHVGVMLLGVGLLTHGGLAGALLYAVGHAGVKGALFLCTGILLQRFSTVNENDLHGRAGGLKVTAAVWFISGLGLAGLPPFATELGKSLMEDEGIAGGYRWVPAVFIVAEALTGGAVLRAGARMFFGIGHRAPGDPSTEEQQGNRETDVQPHGLTPFVMTVPAGLLAAAAVVAGLVPGFVAAVGSSAAQFVDRADYVTSILAQGRRGPRPHHVATHAFHQLGLATGTLATALALGLAALALWLPERARAAGERAGAPPLGVLRALHSGHVGDYAAWLVLGAALLGGGLLLAAG